jgi:hypothetical protein
MANSETVAKSVQQLHYRQAAEAAKENYGAIRELRELVARKVARAERLAPIMETAPRYRVSTGPDGTAWTGNRPQTCRQLSRPTRSRRPVLRSITRRRRRPRGGE